MTSPGPEGKERKSSSGLLWLLIAIAVAGAALMFRLGMGALDMPGAAMEHNKLLKLKTQVCSDRQRLDECARIMKRIEEAETAMKAREKGSGRP